MPATPFRRFRSLLAVTAVALAVGTGVHACLGGHPPPPAALAADQFAFDPACSAVAPPSADLACLGALGELTADPGWESRKAVVTLANLQWRGVTRIDALQDPPSPLLGPVRVRYGSAGATLAETGHLAHGSFVAVRGDAGWAFFGVPREALTGKEIAGLVRTTLRETVPKAVPGVKEAVDRALAEEGTHWGR